MIEFDSMRLIYETTRHISRPILGKFLFIYLVFYYYATFGQIFFGGKLTNQTFKEKCTETPTFYDLLNFNDYSAAMVTLFQQMVVNNWYVTVNMYSNVMGETVWVRLYFVSFWIAIVLIQMNIVIAIVLEIYGSVTEQVRAETHKRSVRAQLRQHFKDAADEETIRQKIQELREFCDKEEAKLDVNSDN